MADTMDFTKKYGPWALVVGGSEGLGGAWSDECAKRGMNVMICARNMEKMQAKTAELREKYGIETKEFQVDIMKEDAADIMLDHIKDVDLGMLVYNAPAAHNGKFIKTSIDDHMNIIQGNVITLVRLIWPLCRTMARKHRGCIMLISSQAGTVGMSNQSLYGSTKAFMTILAETLWYEMKKYGVTVTGVTVGSVLTPDYIRSMQASSGGALEEGQSYEMDLSQFDFELDPEWGKATAHTPEVVGEYVFEHIEDGPRIWSHPEDEAQNNAVNRSPRKNIVTYISTMTDMYFSSGFAQLDDEFEEINR